MKRTGGAAGFRSRTGHVAGSKWRKHGAAPWRHPGFAMSRASFSTPRAAARVAYTGEVKFFETDVDDAVIAGAGTVLSSLNLIAQGLTESARVGRKITVTHIGWRGNVTLPEQDAVATPESGDVARLVVFIDTQANGAAAAVSDIFDTNDWQSFNNLANSQRFRTISDKLITLNYQGLASDGAGVVSQGNIVKPFTFFKKVNIPIEFGGTAGSIDEITSNNIGILLISATGICGMGSKVRIRYRDA